MANSFGELLASPTISGHVLTWCTFALVAGRDTYDLVARDLRTGLQYRLASGGDAAAPDAVVSGPGWGWPNRVVWEQTVDNAGGPQVSYLAITRIP